MLTLQTNGRFEESKEGKRKRKAERMPRRAWITEVRGLGGAGGTVGVWPADEGRQGQNS